MGDCTCHLRIMVDPDAIGPKEKLEYRNFVNFLQGIEPAEGEYNFPLQFEELFGTPPDSGTENS